MQTALGMGYEGCVQTASGPSTRCGCRSSPLWSTVRSCLCKQRLGSGWHCLLEMEEPWRGTYSLAASYRCPEPSQQPSAVALTRQPVEEAVCLGSSRKQAVRTSAPHTQVSHSAVSHKTPPDCKHPQSSAQGRLISASCLVPRH